MNIQDIIAMIMGRLPQQAQAGNPLQGLLQRMQGGMPGQGPGMGQRPAWGMKPPMPWGNMRPPGLPSAPSAAPMTPPTGGVPASAPAPQGNAWGHNFKQQFGMAPGKDQTAFKAFKQGPAV